MFALPLLLVVTSGPAFSAADPALPSVAPAPQPLFPPAAAPPLMLANGENGMRLSFLIGGRSLDEQDWEPLDDPFVLEAVFDYRRPGAALGFEIGTALAYDDDTILGIDIDSTTLELFGGVRATAELADGRLRPYIAAGPTFLLTDVSSEQGFLTASDDDSAFGLYVRAGAAWVFDSGFALGLDYRQVFGADVTLFDVDADADFEQLAVSLGFGF